MSRQVVLEFPVELPEDFLKDEETFRKGKETIVMESLRKRKISQGKAAELLGISRDELFDVMAKYGMPVIDMTEDELKEELSKDIFKKGR